MPEIMASSCTNTGEDMELSEKGVYLVNGTDIVPDTEEASARIRQMTGKEPDRQQARRETMAWSILHSHNLSGDDEKLQIRFDKMASHDITYVGIIQTARASGLEQFPIPYVLTNCHNSLCAVGGTINEDDHMFGLSAAKKYGGIYVPPHQAVIHQFAREMLAECGAMILGSDSHTRYGALGTMAMGEGGGELVKQLLSQTYDIDMPGVVAVYLEGEPAAGVGPQDVALAIIGAVFDKGYVKNKVMEFVGPGIGRLSEDFRIGVDVMTTETTCLSSIWRTDEKTKNFYEIHGRRSAYREMNPGSLAYYDGCIRVNLSKIRPMIAMPFHPSNVYAIEDVQKNLKDVLHDVEERAKVSFGGKISYSLQDKIVDGKLYVDQGIIAGCAGGGFENICAAADILRGHSIGNDEFTMSVYPASMPIYMELVKDGRFADLIEAGCVVKTAFCGPCFGAGDTPANGAFSIRHSTRNFPNREGSKPGNGQMSAVALMDARSIAATAANNGILTSAEEYADSFGNVPEYHFDDSAYKARVYNGFGKADKEKDLFYGPNIKDWPEQPALGENVLLRVCSKILDPVTTTDELIPSGETSSYRSNPLGLAEFTLSRRDPEYVGRSKAVKALEQAREAGKELPELQDVFATINSASDVKADLTNTEIGSVVYANKPGDGSAREQAASCQRVLGGLANITQDYATKRYRSNCINWGMLPLHLKGEPTEFEVGDYIYIPGIRAQMAGDLTDIPAYVVKAGKLVPISLYSKPLTAEEKEIIKAGCLINFNRNKNK